MVDPKHIARLISEDPDMPQEPIKKFMGKNRFLSNFWPGEVVYEKHRYPSVEHAYQAAKTLDKAAQRAIRFAEKPGQAKKLGKKVEMRPDWDQIKLQVMEDLTRQKYNRNPELKAKLLATGDADLQEGNTWNDTFWGINVKTGEGENNLGKILMKVRDELR